MFTRKSRQSGRAHVDIVVLMTCLGTLAIVTSPGQSQTTANKTLPESTLVAAASPARPGKVDSVLADAAGGSQEISLISASTAR